MRVGLCVAVVLGLALPAAARDLPSISKSGPVTVVTLHDEIDLGNAAFVDRLLRDAAADDLIVLDINTLGGRLDAGLTIRDALLHTAARTVCWVNPRAISAGALIALACDVIAVAPGATIGAATPVQIENGEMKPVEQKVVSYMRGEMRATAEAKGRRGDIAEAMVDASVEIPGLDDKTRLLTLDGQQALAWGMADIAAADAPALWRALGRDPPAHIRHPQLSWSERIAGFLAEPLVAGLLMTLGMLGILIELWAPGHGLSLAAGIGCLSVFFFGHYIVLLAGWEEIVVFVVGVVLVACEILIPGHVLPGVIGAVCIVASLVLALVAHDVPLRVAWDSGRLPDALGVVFGSIAATAALGWGVTRILPRTRVGRALVLETQLPSLVKPQLAEYLDVVGTAVTDLRPVGKVALGGGRYDAVAEHSFVAAGATIRVVRVDGIRLVVREEP